MTEAISKETLLNNGCLTAPDIRTAFDCYESAIIHADNSSDMYNYIRYVFALNADRAYADFYYTILSEEQKKEFVSGLNEAEKTVLEELQFKDEDVYYPLNEKLLRFLFDISAREWLFSTFYFGKRKITIWGNYRLQFPVFCEDKETLAYYKEIAKDYGLECYI